MRSLIFSGLLLCSGVVSAFVGDCCCDYNAGVDLLYWRASHCPINYARSINFGDSQFTELHFIRSDFDWGVRVWGERDTNCGTFGLSYLWLETTDSADTRRGNFEELRLQSQFSNVDFAKSSLKFRYQKVDFQLRHALIDGCGYSHEIVGLARWADIDMKYRAAGTVLSDEIHPSVIQSTSYDGVGLGVGFAGEYCLPSWLDVGGQATLSALIGRQSVGESVITDPDGTSSPFRATSPGFHSTLFVPEVELDLHISYSVCRCGTLWTLRLGYELHYFWDALQFASLGPVQNFVPVRDCQSVGFGGLYLGLSANF
jgi:Legionella pneumophila major outer membrane protein precursor